MKSIPKTAKKKAKVNGCAVLAEGEQTGHSHKFKETAEVELFENKDVLETQTYLQIKAAADLIHEEHTKHTIQPGIGEVRIQTEYDMGTVRRMLD